ncbi:hypothetical protein JCM5353_004714 [Sporobolomyces roseus]
MSSALASSTSSYQFSDLSFELINIILASIELHADLASCCRVNKYFLTRCRPALYHHLPVSIGGSTPASNSHPERYLLKESSELLLRTLENNKELQQYPRKLTLDTRYFAEQKRMAEGDPGQPVSEKGGGTGPRRHYQFPGSDFDDLSQPFERCLRLIPQMDSVEIDSTLWQWECITDVVFKHVDRWKEIELGGELLLWAGENENWDFRKFSRLEKLRCRKIGDTDLPGQHLPQSLRTLDTYDSSVPVGDPSSEYQLRSVRAALTGETLDSLVSYPKVRYLHLVQNWYDCEPPLLPSTLVKLQTLPVLLFLSICLEYESSSIYNAAAAILQHSPPELQCLEFPCLIPFDELNSFLSTRTTPSPPLLRLGKTQACEPLNAERLDAVKAVCLQKEIHIEYITSFAYWGEPHSSTQPN